MNMAHVVLFSPIGQVAKGTESEKCLAVVEASLSPREIQMLFTEGQMVSVLWAPVFTHLC